MGNIKWSCRVQDIADAYGAVYKQPIISGQLDSSPAGCGCEYHLVRRAPWTAILPNGWPYNVEPRNFWECIRELTEIANKWDGLCPMNGN